jgi:hypothetical protein
MRTWSRLVPMRTWSRLVPMRTWSRLVPISWTETLSKFTAGAGGIDIAKERISELSIISLIVIKLN